VPAPAAASEDSEPAALHLEGLPVGLADQPCHPLHAAVNHLLDIGGPKRPLPVVSDLIVDFHGGEAHDLVTPHACVPDNAKVAEGHGLKARLEEVEGTVEAAWDLRFAGAVDLLVGSVETGESGCVFFDFSRMKN